MNIKVFLIMAITFFLSEKVILQGEFQNFPITIKNGEEVNLKFVIKNVSDTDLPEDAFRYELWINGEMKSLDNFTPSIPSGNVMTYSKEDGHYHFKAKTGTDYLIQVKIIPKKIGEVHGLKNQIIEKKIKVSS